MKSIFEQIGGTYRKEGDYLIPNLELPETDDRFVGKFGMLRRDFLKEHHPALYSQMLLTGTLREHLLEIDRSCRKRRDFIYDAIAKQEGITEALKASNSFAWVIRSGDAYARAEEVVLNELVYTV